MEFTSVAALADNHVIGHNGDLPWESLPADKQQYRERVTGSPVILGRRTYESMRMDLPGRRQIVLSRQKRVFGAESAIHAVDIDSAINMSRQIGANTVYILGGAAIYSLFQPHIDRMVLTRVPGVYQGDSYYPEWNEDAWTLMSIEDYPGFTLEEWTRTRK
jgi:dihydrofolate reductase